MKHFNPHSIRNLREELGLTQNEFARKIEGTFQAQHVSTWENGSEPSLKTLAKIVNAYGIPFDYFFENLEEDQWGGRLDRKRDR